MRGRFDGTIAAPSSNRVVPVKSCWIVLVAVLSGCAVSPHVERPRLPRPVAETMSVEIRLVQHEMIVSHGTSSAGSAAGVQLAGSPAVAGGGFAAGAAAGLIGALIDVAIDAHRSSVADEAARPLREHMQGVDADALAVSSLDGLDHEVLAREFGVERIDRSEADDEKDSRLREGRDILVLTPSYFVSYDGATFTYVLNARLVDRVAGKNGRIVTTQRYRQAFQYLLTGQSQDAFARMDAGQWTALLAAASKETVEMLNYDVSTQPSDAQPKRKFGPLTVLVDQPHGERTWVRTAQSMLSVPTASLAGS